ncbi:hypothetical protein SMICM17S_07574 [Streptomyces microflavus]
MAIIKDDDVRATRLRSGDLDGAILPPNLAKGFEDDKAKKTYAAATYDYRTVTLPTHNKVAGDTAVRRALDVAVDRQTMVDAILNGSGKPAYGPVPTDSEWFTKGTERTHDLAAATTILDEAGWFPGRTASGSRTACVPRSRSGTSPVTSSARSTPSPTPPTPRRRASPSPPRPGPGRSSSPA